MTGCGNIRINIAISTVTRVCGEPAHCTGRFRYNRRITVPRCRNVVTDVAVTAVTRMGGVAAFGARGRGYNRGINMNTGGRGRFTILHRLVALGANPPFHFGGCTGGRGDNRPIAKRMLAGTHGRSRCGINHADLARGCNVPTVGTLDIVRLPVVIAEENVQNQSNKPLYKVLVRINLYIVMLGCGDFLNHRMTTRANVSHLARRGTGCGFGHRGGVFMPCCLKNLVLGVAARAITVPRAVRGTGGVHIFHPFAAGMPFGFDNVILIGMTASTGVQVVAVLFASRRNRNGAVRVPQRIGIVRAVPLAANGAGVLIIAPFGAGGVHPHRRAVGVSVTIMRPLGNKASVTGDGHALGKALPAAKGVAELFGRGGRNDCCAVILRLGGNDGAVTLHKRNGILLCHLFNKKLCRDVHRRGCRERVRHAVSVQIPTLEHIVVVLTFFKNNGWNANDL